MRKNIDFLTNDNLNNEENQLKTPAVNGRFGASGGVARPTVCADFQPFAPVRVVVETPACRQAAATLAAISGRHDTVTILKENRYGTIQ